MLFECHITYPRDKADIIEKFASDLHWKFSKIDGDPVLGKEIFCYLTTHSDDYMKMFSKMIATVHTISNEDIKPVREKIELIMFDTKVKV